MTIFTIADGCTACGACLLTCPEHALRIVRPARPHAPPLVVLAERCTGCAECAEVCPVDACVPTAPGVRVLGVAS